MSVKTIATSNNGPLDHDSSPHLTLDHDHENKVVGSIIPVHVITSVHP